MSRENGQEGENVSYPQVGPHTSTAAEREAVVVEQ